MKDFVIKLLEERYFEDGEKTWDDIAKRVSYIHPDIYEYIRDMYYIPSSPTLMNAGAKTRKGTFSSCFIMNIEDSIDGIFDALKEAAYVTRASGGIGYDFSKLRASTEVVKSTGRTSGGPLSFIYMFDGMLEGVRQGGARRGAGMAQLSIYHPDILKFIDAKKDITKYNRFNFSIRIDDAFYNRLEKDPDGVHFVKNVGNSLEYALQDLDGATISVHNLWDRIIDNAYNFAEPGIFNISIAEDRCSVLDTDNYVSSNPCSEFTGIPYQSCSLGSINLEKLIEGKRFNWEKFDAIIIKSVNYLNAMIDKNNFPLEKIEKITKETRPIGLGIMGLATALYKKGVRYSSLKSKKFIEDICKYATIQGMVESVKLAKLHGSYKSFNYDTFMKANERFFTSESFKGIDVTQLKKDIKKYGIRNSAITSIAPTGTISFLAETSGGIEPIFALCYTRKIEVGNKIYEKVYITDPIFDDYLKNTFSEKEREAILDEVSNNKGSCQKCRKIPQEIKDIFVVAGDLTPEEHLDILESVANNISLSVSKTINLPKDCSKEEISKVFVDAHQRGIIGVTCYRDGSREGILLHKEDNKETFVERHAPKRPRELPCHVYKITVKGEKWNCFIGLYNGRPYEIFSGRVKLVDIPSSITEGTLVKTDSGVYQFVNNGEVIIADISKLFDCGEQESITRLISTALRHGVPINFISDQLSKSYGTIVDFNKSILRSFKRYLKNEDTGEICEVCGSKIIYVEGCKKCSDPECGFAKCG